MKSFLAIVSAALVAASPINLRLRQDDPRSCNGNPLLCDRQYSNITFIGTHNSAFVGDNYDPRVNQQKTVTEQLDAGIRFLQAQVHYVEDPLSQAVSEAGDFFDDLFSSSSDDDDEADKPKGELRMCHTDCLLFDAGTLSSYLSEVKTWMDTHPDDLLTLLLVNYDNRPANDFDAVFTSTDLKDLAFTPPTHPEPLAKDAWPTLAQMLDANTRLVSFLSTGSDIPYLLPEFSPYIFETPFETTDPSFPSCALDRPAGATDTEGRMYLVNHFLQHKVLDSDDVLVPAGDEAGTTNGVESLGGHVQRCEGVWGRKPNFVLVDFFDEGMVGGVQAGVNGL